MEEAGAGAVEVAVEVAVGGGGRRRRAGGGVGLGLGLGLGLGRKGKESRGPRRAGRSVAIEEFFDGIRRGCPGDPSLQRHGVLTRLDSRLG